MEEIKTIEIDKLIGIAWILIIISGLIYEVLKWDESSDNDD